MEKISRHKDSHYHRSYPLTILYKEDLENLTQIFNDNFSEIQIEADEYKLDNIEELNEFKKDKINEFNLEGYDKGKDSIYREYKMCLHIKNKSMDIYINCYDDMRCIGVQKKLEELISVRVSTFNKLISKSKTIVNNLFVPLSLFLLVIYSKNIKTIYFIFYCIIILIFYILVDSLLTLISNSLTNYISIKYSWEKQSFYQRNRDNIIVGIICALFGTVIGGLVIYFITEKFLGPPNP